MRNVCENKTKAIDLVDSGIIDAYALLMSCIAYMSEHEVEDMLHCDGYLEDAEEEDDDDADDDDNDDDGADADDEEAD